METSVTDDIWLVIILIIQQQNRVLHKNGGRVQVELKIEDYCKSFTSWENWSVRWTGMAWLLHLLMTKVLFLNPTAEATWSPLENAYRISQHQAELCAGND